MKHPPNELIKLMFTRECHRPSFLQYLTHWIDDIGLIQEGILSKLNITHQHTNHLKMQIDLNETLAFYIKRKV